MTKIVSPCSLLHSYEILFFFRNKHPPSEYPATTACKMMGTRHSLPSSPQSEHEQMAMLGAWAPALEELCAADNDISDVLAITGGEGGCAKVEGFQHLHSLDLSETNLTSWEQVHSVGNEQKGGMCLQFSLGK